jgi:hypothetical protein
LSAKLNNALFAARTVAEGGDGTLCYRLSKESADKTLSLLFQDNFSGRAEIGLTGDDDFHLKVSGDGENWVEAVVIDNQSGEATLAAPATIRTDTGIVLNLDLDGGDGVFQATRYAAGPSAPVFFGRKARGTRDAPEAVQAGDTLIGFRGYAYTGTEFLRAAEGVAFLLEAAENISDSAYGTQIRFFTTLNGTTTIEERVRIAHDGALQMGGENTVVDANRHFMLRAYTVATLPQATVPGQLIYVSDGAANKRLAVSDGTGWRWSDGTTVT